MSTTIRDARERYGVGVRELARRCGVAPATVTDWERSELAGTARAETLERALAAMGERPLILSSPVGDAAVTLDRREQRLGLELHRVIAGKLIDDPDSVLAAAAARLPSVRDSVHGPLARSWVDQWQQLIAAASVGRLIDVMLGTSQRDIDMRQVSPFAHLVDQAERRDVLARATA